MKSMDLLKLLVIVSFTAGCTTATQHSSESEISNSESSVLESSSLTAEPSNSDSSSPSAEISTPSSESEPPIIEPSIIQVYVPTDFEYIYAWTQDVEDICGAWPGSKLQDYNENWKTYILEGYESLNFVLADASGEIVTNDLIITSPGSYWFNNGKLQDSEPVPPEIPTPEVASSWEDFKLWNEYPNDYWTINNKYEGSRKDFRNESIYYVTTTRFYDGDTGNNFDCWVKSNPDNDPAWRGDFKGLIEKMDYIKALGFSTILVTPVVENASENDFSGYYAYNMNKVDPRLCSEDVDFQKVIDEAHQRDMKVCLDVVLNHTGTYGESNLLPLFYKGNDSPALEDLMLADNSPLPYNYFSLTDAQKYIERYNAINNSSTGYSDLYSVYHHQDDKDEPTIYDGQQGHITRNYMDLNTENPIVAEYLIRSYGNFIKMGVDAFKIDSAINTSRLTLNKYYVPAFYKFAELCGNNNFFIFGDVSCGGGYEGIGNKSIYSSSFYTWNEEKEYEWSDFNQNIQSIKQFDLDNDSMESKRQTSNAILQENQYHSPDHSNSNRLGVMDYPMHYYFDDAIETFKNTLIVDQYYNDSTYNVTYVDSNDSGTRDNPNARFSKGTLSWAENLNLMFTFRGIPCVTYGSEIEFQKGTLFNFEDNLALENTAHAYFGENIDGQVTASNFGEFSANGMVSDTLNSPLAKHIIKLNQIRHAIPALQMGQYTTDETSVTADSIGFIRRYTGTEGDSLALVSISGGATFKNIPNGKYIDAITGDVQNVTRGMLTISSVGKGNMRIYVCCASSFIGINEAVGQTGQTYLK